MNGFLARAAERFAIWDERFQERSLRERAVLSIALVGVLFLLVDALFLRPAAAELERIDRLTVAARDEVGVLEGELATFGQVEFTPEQRLFLERRKRVEAELDAINQDIAGEIAELVPPESIVSVLERMLESDPRLKLVEVRSEAPHHVGSDSLHATDSSVLDATKRLYRHGLRIEIEGDFASTLDYLERVETSPWHLLWDRFEYRVEDYPNARVTIDLHTVSEQEEWIGV